MNEEQAYEAMSDYEELKAVEGGPLILAKAKGYLEAIEKAQMLAECIDGLICGVVEAELAEEILRKWEKEK